MNYSNYGMQKRRKPRRLIKFFVVLIMVTLGFIGYKLVFDPVTIEERIENELTFDVSVTEDEKIIIREAITNQNIAIQQSVNARVVTLTSPNNDDLVLEAYVPVSDFNAIEQGVMSIELVGSEITVPTGTDETIKTALAKTIGTEAVPATVEEGGVTELLDTEVAFVPVSSLNSSIKLLNYEGNYYLESFKSGALFREVVFEGEGASVFADLKLNALKDKEDVFKVNMTGVTALTRIMQRKLASVGDPLYFSALIGDFLADADLTHVSNEVSFKPGCSYSNTVFCSPPEFIETLKASGVDLVELTGNHNNDSGSNYNTQSIELYQSLGWGTVGGGLNTVEAAKPFVSDVKGSNVTFLAYNYPDSPNGGAIAGTSKAGANSWDIAKIESDITAAKQNSDFVIVNVQYWECYAYPDGYVEFPECDKPIGEQEANFKKLIDFGADMVVGSSAHQPQTYELYEGKPIYYGLGNLYFDQTSWPGTERGIILTHYFLDGQLLQTKLTPTVYDEDLQTRKMTVEESNYLLSRLHTARN